MKSLIAVAALSLISIKAVSAEKKPVVYIPFGQAEFAYNIIKECPAIEVTWIQEKADFLVSWGMNEKENRNDWVVYTIDGRVAGFGEATRVSATARDICRAITRN